MECRRVSSVFLGAASLCVVLGVSACKNNDAVLGVVQVVPPPPGSGIPVSLSGDIQPIFNNNCAFAGCHAGASPAVNLSLEAGKTFDPNLGLVNVSSFEAPSLKRVEPGNAAGSYVVHKLEGTQASVGGSGSRMPLGFPPLAGAEIQLIKDWIDQGAQNN
jgi:hypothetical protein